MNTVAIDIRTLLLVSAIVFLCRAGLLAYAWLINRDYPPIKYWALGSSLAAVGVLFLSLRGIVPLSVSVLVGHTGLIVGWICIAAGTITATGRRPPWRWGFAIATAALTGAACFLFIWPDDLVRTLFVSAPGLLFDAYCVHACLRFVGSRWRRATFRILAVTLSASIASSLLKAYYTIRFGSGALFDANAQNSQFYLLSIFVLIACTVIYVLLAEQKSQEDLAQEVEQRKLSAQTLRISEERHRLIAENARDVIWTMSLDGKYTYVSPSVETVRGFSPAEALQQTMEETLTPASQAVALAYFTQLQADLRAGRAPQGFRGELEYRCKDGSTLWAEVMTYPVRDEKGLLIEILGVTRDISERKRAEALVRDLAYHDRLTGLANRLLLSDRLTQVMLSGERGGHYGALLFLDLDNFKPLNDAHGHAAGDLLLIEVARRLKSLVRQVDTVARFGGDEFVVVLDELSADKALAQSQAMLLAGKIGSVLAEPYALQLTADASHAAQGIEHRCTASIGVVLFLGMANTENEVIRRADIAMYRAKAAGRNGICLFEGDGPQQAPASGSAQ